jgi:hypothetical protein
MKGEMLPPNRLKLNDEKDCRQRTSAAPAALFRSLGY